MDGYALNFKPLVNWFSQHRRDLPWRENPSPYAVWVSETMLQQTQVKAVIPYYERWMSALPTLQSLAEAGEETVLKLWEGLGYYSRLRNLHEGAKYCLHNYGGKIPETEEELLKIKGIGPYTVGAILSFAFHKRKSAIDGNVLRVVSRIIGLEDPIEKTSSRKLIEQTLEKSLPQQAPWEAMEAVIELGALVCKKSPSCFSCPMKEQCLSFREDKTSFIPVKKTPPKTIKLIRHALLLSTDTEVLLKQGEKGKVMEGLFEFPYFDDALPQQAFGSDLSQAKPLGKVEHAFTRYKVDLFAWEKKVEKLPEERGYVSVPIERVSKLTFSSGMRKLLQKGGFPTGS